MMGFVNNEQAEVGRIKLPHPPATIPTGNDRPASVAITPDGAYAYITSPPSGSVLVIDTATNTVSATINISLSTASQPQVVAITPNGANVYVTNDYPTVSVMTIGGINPVGNGGNGGNGGTTGLGGSGGAAGTPGGTSGTRGQNGVVIPG